MQTCNPSHARAWFKWQERINWVVSVGIMAVLFFVLMQFFPALVAFFIALAVTSGLYFFILFNRAIGIVCPHCKKLIETNTPWICGYKGCRNENADDFPFISECEYCHAKPKAYKCHHKGCEKLIFFTKDEQTINFAQCINMPVPVKSEAKRAKRDRHAEEMAELRKSIERKEMQTKAGKLDAELKGINQTIEGPKMKSVEDLYRAELKNEDDERRLRAKIDKDCENDEEERKRRHLIVDRIMREII